MSGFGGRFWHSKAQAALRARCASTGTLQKRLQCIACPTIRATPDHNKGLLLVELYDAIQLQTSNRKQRLGACARWQAEYGAIQLVVLIAVSKLILTACRFVRWSKENSEPRDLSG